MVLDGDNDEINDIVTIFGGSDTFEVRFLQQLQKKQMPGPNAMISPTVFEPDAFLICDLPNDGINETIVHSATDGTIYVYPGK
jgi:hypothetical protein